MPQKIRELKAQLSKAGFQVRSGKGSHTVWEHSLLQEIIAISGNDGNDAKPYQEKAVRSVLEKLDSIKDIR